jgi:hypothetical protein
MTWHAFEEGAPELAVIARDQFASRVALMGTIRRDGSVRLWPENVQFRRPYG